MMIWLFFLVLNIQLLLPSISAGNHPQKKVAILGGGFASCTTALYLTSQPRWKEHYDVTIYQVGWRLGGKAASGRNKKYGYRIEDVFDHVWAANYFNARKMMKEVYEELNRTDDVPLSKYEEALVPKNWLSGYSSDIENVKEEDCLQIKHLFQKLLKFITETTKELLNIYINLEISENINVMGQDFWKLLNSIKIPTGKHASKDELKQVKLTLLDLAVTVAKGIVKDGLLEYGFDIINNQDLRQWLHKHGAMKDAVNSYMVHMQYKLFYAYRNVNISEPDMEAGTSLKVYLTWYLCYNGIQVLDIKAGGGDVAFAPIYQVLKERGVKFKFFHRVKDLLLHPSDKSLVEQIKLTKQVDLVNSDYSPLIDVKGLPSWPNEPKYEEIDKEQAYILQENNIDLESFWTDWPMIYQKKFHQPLPEITLKRGVDFDIVVFGISVASLPFLCSQLLEASPSLRSTHQHVGTTASQITVVWFDISAQKYITPEYFMKELKFEFSDPMIYARRQITKFENWERIGQNAQFSIWLTAMQNIEDIPSNSEHNFLYRNKENAKKYALYQFENSFQTLLPELYNNGEFNWTVLTDPENRVGMARFDAQYWRSNINPSDRYTQILTNTSQYRITTDGAGFDNVYFTGDWIQNGFNIGSIEGAVTAGMLTCRAISRYPDQIAWQDDDNN